MTHSCFCNSSVNATHSDNYSRGVRFRLASSMGENLWLVVYDAVNQREWDVVDHAWERYLGHYSTHPGGGFSISRIDCLLRAKAHARLYSSPNEGLKVDGELDERRYNDALFWVGCAISNWVDLAGFMTFLRKSLSPGATPSMVTIVVVLVQCQNQS
jgi:hypothetical protein